MKMTRSAGLGAGIVVASMVVSGALVAPAEAAKLPKLGAFGIHTPGWVEHSARQWTMHTKGKSCMIARRCAVRGWLIQSNDGGMWLENAGRTKSKRAALKLAASIRVVERTSLSLAVEKGSSHVRWRKVRASGAKVWSGTGFVSNAPSVQIRYVIVVNGNRVAYAAGFKQSPPMPQGKRLSKPLVRLVKSKRHVPKIKGRAHGLIPVVQAMGH
ncbi:MAG: hypothetical protein ACOYD0_12015 [Candidatus Nanopelagicales bacterium]